MAETREVSYFCPVCGSPRIDTEEVSGTASCRSCKWVGRGSELLAHSFAHDFISGESALITMINELRTLVTPLVTDLANFLSKWGFITTVRPEELRRQLGMYCTAMGHAIFSSIVSVREKIDAEGRKTRD